MCCAIFPPMLEYVWEVVKVPRVARERSRTGVYHVILRGINGQVIFIDDEDFQKLLLTIKDCRGKSGFEIYAYCLMSNHVHLLMKEEKEELGIVFRRVGASYVHWYNRKYGRRGHLFQDRYKSEAVEIEGYFLTVIRYIHQNPLKAGIVGEIGDYPWSSYREYIEKPWICNTEFALDLFSKDKEKARALFKDYNLQENKDECFEYDQNARLNDAEATDFIKSISRVKSPTEIQGYEKGKLNDIIKRCRNRGLSIRQIERLTGVSFGVIRRVERAFD